MAVSISDLQNGTGISATSSGHTLSRLYVAQTGSGSSLNLVATINNNGTQNVSLAVGSYVGVWLVDNVWGAPFRFRATASASSIHERCLVELRQLVIDSSLPMFPADQSKYKVHKRPVRTIAEFGDPPNGVHFWPLPETAVPLDNYNNTVTYPVQMVLVRGNNGDNIIDSGWLLARQTLLQAFPRTPLAQVTNIHTVTIEPGAIYAETDGGLNVDAQGMIFRCVTTLCFSAI